MSSNLKTHYLHKSEHNKGEHSLHQSIRYSIASWGDKKQITKSLPIKEMKTTERLKGTTEYLIPNYKHTQRRKKAEH